MSYLSAVVTIDSIATSPDLLPGDTGKRYLHHHGFIPSQEPVAIVLELKPDGEVAKAITEPGHYLIAGELRKQQVTKENGEKGGEFPVVRVFVASPAAEGQFLNEVSIVGRIGGEAREASSGKSSRVGVAVNRYRQVAGQDKPEELTDWFTCRGFGYTKEKLEKVGKGALVELQGCLSQLENKDGEPYFEVRLRSLRSHGKGSGGSARGVAPAAESEGAVAGYSEESFAGADEGWD